MLPKTNPSVRELILFSAILISTVALSIDIMLPSLGDIATYFQISESNQRQWVITSLLGGLSIGQLVLGPLSDRIGRRPVIFLGTGFFMLGSIVAIFASDFETFLAGRIIQGFGAAGPRIAIMALIRDRFEGQVMARVMSFILGVFIVIPTVAPSLGQALLLITDWRGLIVFVAGFLATGAIWFLFRQPETLPYRKNEGWPQLRGDIITVLTSPTPMIYTLCGACCFGAFLGFITSSQQLFQDLFQVGNQFAILLGICSAFVGASMFVNARLVKSYSMERICIVAMAMLVFVSLSFALLTGLMNDDPAIGVWMAFTCCALFLLGLTFGNFNAIALRNLGHVAGLASSIYATITSIFSVAFASLIGLSFNMSTLPVTVGYAVFGSLSLAMMLANYAWQRKRSSAT